MHLNAMRLIQLTTAAFALALLAAPLHAREVASIPPTTVPASGVIGVEEAYLSPDFWIARLRRMPDRVVLDPAAIAAQNDKLMRIDDSMHDLRAMPATLGREQVAGMDQGSFQSSGRASVRRRWQAGASRDARRHRRQPGTRRDSGATTHALRPGRAARGPAHLPDRAARVQRAGRHRHRPLPGKRAVPGHAGGDRAPEPRRRLAVRRQPALRGMDRKAASSPKARRTRCSTTSTRRPIASSPAPRSIPCSPASSRSCRNCSSTWACACRWPTCPRTRRSTASIPTRRTCSNCRSATPTASCSSRRRCCRRTPTPRPTTCR